MSNKTNERKVLLANLARIWPNAKLGKTSNADLVWLSEVAQHLAPKTRAMSEILSRYRTTYEPTLAYSGRKSLTTGDELAHKLAGLSPEQVIRIAEQALGLQEGELAERYENLNPGQKRMNAGNRLRAAIKRGDLTPDAIQITH